MAEAGTIAFNLLVYLFGAYIVRRNGGLKKNLPFAFSLILFVLYHFITPMYFYFSGRKTIWGDVIGYNKVGEDITDYYLLGINYYGLANLLFIIGYLAIRNRKEIIQQIAEDTNNLARQKTAIIVSFCVCFGIVLFNYLQEGLNPFLILFGSKDDEIAGITATSNYLKNFTDSIIAILIIGYYYRVKKVFLYPMTILGFTLFALMGFRYRIILTILGIIFVGLYQLHKENNRRFVLIRNVVLLSSFIYVMFFITYNRFVFTSGNWDKLVTNPAKFEYSVFFEQTRGMLDDITVIKYYKTDPHPEHDYGVTFLYFFIRAMPRSIVGDEFKDSFYPFPAYTIFTKAYGIQKYWGKSNTGEAPLHLAYFYIAGGLPFLLIGSFVVGLMLKLFQHKFHPDKSSNILILVLLTAGLFQWYTRGYFPGFVDHMAFMMIGYFMVRLLSKVPKLTLR